VAIRKWVRQSSQVATDLGVELDSTLPSAALKGPGRSPTGSPVPTEESGDPRRRGRAYTTSTVSNADFTDRGRAYTTSATSTAEFTDMSTTSFSSTHFESRSPGGASAGSPASGGSGGKIAPLPKRRALASSRTRRLADTADPRQTPLPVEQREGVAGSLTPPRERSTTEVFLDLPAGTTLLDHVAANAPAAAAANSATAYAPQINIVRAPSPEGDALSPRGELMRAKEALRRSAEVSPVGGRSPARSGSPRLLEEPLGSQEAPSASSPSAAGGSPTGKAKGWRDIKEDLDSMHLAFRGQLDRLLQEVQTGQGGLLAHHEHEWGVAGSEPRFAAAAAAGRP